MNSLLFSPLTMRGLTLPNRVIVSPMCQDSAVDDPDSATFPPRADTPPTFSYSARADHKDTVFRMTRNKRDEILPFSLCHPCRNPLLKLAGFHNGDETEVLVRRAIMGGSPWERSTPLTQYCQGQILLSLSLLPKEFYD